MKFVTSSLRTVFVVLCVLVGGLLAVASSPNHSAFASGNLPNADFVYGQPDFTSSAPNNGGVSATSSDEPTAIAFDSSGGTYIADATNYRVLYYAAGSRQATRVYGQPNFTSNIQNNGGISATSLAWVHDVALGPDNGLYVADCTNNRVLYYPPWQPGDPTAQLAATRVYGQPNFTSSTANNGGISERTLACPRGLAVSPLGEIYATDMENNRVLYYPAWQSGDPTTNIAATRVYGQPNFTGLNVNEGGPSATSLYYPSRPTLDAAGGLYVTDGRNNRELYYSAWQTGDPVANIAAMRVYGQPDFQTTGINTGGLGPSSLSQPGGVALSPDGTVYICDSNNYRVLGYQGNNTTASSVYGQPNFTTNLVNNGGVSATSLNYCRGLAVTADGTLYIVDSYNHRVLRFTPPTLTQAMHLAFTTQPSGGQTNTLFPAQPVVAVQDTGGNTINTYNGLVGVTIKAGSGANYANLYGTRIQQAVNGVATFTDLSINLTADNYVLSATSGNLSSDSAPFAITPPPGTHLVVIWQPRAMYASVPFAMQPRVMVKDANDQLVPGYSGTVTLTLTGGTSGAVLGGPTSMVISNGIAAFNDLFIDKSGTGYKLTATSGTLSSTDSVAFDVTSVPTHLVFSQQPANSLVGQPLTTQPTVLIEDANGQVVPSYNGTVTLAIKPNTGTSGAVLGGTTSVAVSNGVATFNDVSINKVGSGYILTAVSNGLLSSDSILFTVVPAQLAQLAEIAPDPAISGLSFGGPIALDGNTAIIYSGNSQASGVLYAYTYDGALWHSEGLLMPTVQHGQYTGNLVLSGDTAAVGVYDGSFKVLIFVRNGTTWSQQALLTPTNNTNFTDIPAVAIDGDTVLVGDIGTNTAYIFSRTNGNWTEQTSFTSNDAVVGDDFGFSVALHGTTAVVGAFGKNNKTGAVYVFTNGSNGWSQQVKLIANDGIANDQLGFTLALSGNTIIAAQRLPGNASYIFASDGTTWSQQAKLVAAGSSNAAGGQSVNIYDDTVLIGAGNDAAIGSAYLFQRSGTMWSLRQKISANDGKAGDQFGDYVALGNQMALISAGGKNNGAGVTYFFGPPLSGEPAALSFMSQPGNTQASTPFDTQPSVVVQDAYGQTVTKFSDTVTLALTGGTSGAVLSGTTSVAASNGVANFSGLSIDKPGMGYKLTATSGALSSADTEAFDITPLPATHLSLVWQPGEIRAGVPFAVQPQVVVQDVNGQTVSSYNGLISLALTGGASGAILGGVTSLNVSNGIASFSGLFVDKPGMGYTLSVSSGVLDGVVSVAFNVLPAGQYVQMELRTLSLSSTELVATLDLHNLTGAPIPLDTKVAFTFDGLSFKAHDRTHTYIEGATWTSLSTHSGVAALTSDLTNGGQLHLILHFGLTRPVKNSSWVIKAFLSSTISGKTVRFSSNALGAATQADSQALTILAPKGLKAGSKAVITFSGNFFANNEPLLISITPQGSFKSIPVVATTSGGLVIKTTTGLAPGVYMVTVYGWYSGLHSTGSITLTS